MVYCEEAVIGINHRMLKISPAQLEKGEEYAVLLLFSLYSHRVLAFLFINLIVSSTKNKK